MNILEAINQKSFDSSYEKAVVNLLYTHNWVRDRQQEVFKPYGLKMQHYNVLRILKGRYPEAYSPGEIKEVMLDKAPDLTRLIDKMVDMGLVDRHLCPDNRRKMNVFITDKGQYRCKVTGQRDLAGTKNIICTGCSRVNGITHNSGL